MKIVWRNLSRKWGQRQNEIKDTEVRGSGQQAQHQNNKISEREDGWDWHVYTDVSKIDD